MKRLSALISTFLIALSMAFQFPRPLTINAATSLTFTYGDWLNDYYTDHIEFGSFNKQSLTLDINCNSHCVFYKDENISGLGGGIQRLYSSISFIKSPYDTMPLNIINLIDISPLEQVDGLYAINFSDFNVNSEAQYFQIDIYTDLDDHDNTLNTLLNTSTWELGDKIDTYLVNFYSGLSLYYWHIYPLILAPTMPLVGPTKDGYTFKEWRTYTGDAYDLSHVPTASDIATYFVNGDTLNLYAVFTNDKTAEEFVGNSPVNLQTALSQLGLWNDTGKILLYLVILLLILIPAILWGKLNKFILIVISMLITILFAFIGLLPLYVTIISMAIYLLFLFLNVRGETE